MKNFILSLTILLASYGWHHVWTINLVHLKNMNIKEQKQLIKDIKKESLSYVPLCKQFKISFVESEENINEINVYTSCIKWGI